MTELCDKFHRNYDLTAADYLVFPVHKPGHWIIIIIADIQHEEVLLFDPLSLGLKIDHLHLRCKVLFGFCISVKGLFWSL